MQISTFVKKFYAWNFLGLLVLCLLLRRYDTAVSILQWPASSCLSILALSSLTFHLNHRIRTIPKLLFSGIIFSFCHWILTGFFEVILTRFFRLPETYALRTFGYYLSDHSSLFLDGLIWFGVYMIFFSWIRSQLKIISLTESSLILEKELGQLDIRTLNQEMSPHFLFNAMNGISMKVRMERSKEAVNMIAALTDLLRLNLSKKEDAQITLKEEVELLDKYLIIEQSRFGEDFKLKMDFPDALMSMKVPRLILQPLVENAFKHGMNHQFQEMVVRIEGRELGKYLILSVYNSQVDHSIINFVNSNVGLPNIVHRLRRYYGTDFQFQSLSAQDGVVFKICIPRRS